MKYVAKSEEKNREEKVLWHKVKAFHQAILGENGGVKAFWVTTICGRSENFDIWSDEKPTILDNRCLNCLALKGEK